MLNWLRDINVVTLSHSFFLFTFKCYLKSKVIEKRM